MTKAPLFRTLPPLLALIAGGAMMTLSACDRDKAADSVTQADKALGGHNGQPVMTRPVRIGLGGPAFDACPTKGQMSRAVPVLWSPDEGAPVKATLTEGAQFWPCDRQSAPGWIGIIFAAEGQEINGCAVARRIRTSMEYQGPCRTGWVPASVLPLPAADGGNTAPTTKDAPQ